MRKLVEHPLLQHRLALLRSADTGTKLFRQLVREMTHFLAFEALRDLPTRSVTVRTPMGEASGAKLAGHMQTKNKRLNGATACCLAPSNINR